MALALVTGATGFIGPHLVERLKSQGYDVRCLVRGTSNTGALSRLGVQFARGDVTQDESLAAALADVSVVFHLAGLTKALRRADMQHVNQQGVRNVAAACARQAQPPVLVLVSSLAAAGPMPNGALRSPADPPAPVSHYGHSKRAGELAAAQFAAQTPITVVRPPAVFGEGDTNCLRIFQPIAKFGVHGVVRGGRDRLSLVHVADLAQALTLAAERGTRLSPGEPGSVELGRGFYFAAADEHPDQIELGHMIGAALGRSRVRVLNMPPIGPWLIGTIGQAVQTVFRKPAIINWDKIREVTAGSWTCDPATAKVELGYQPAASLADRLRQTAEWYRRERWL